METYEQIIAEITDKIKTNGNKEITGAILQGVLLGIIAAVQANQEEKLEYYSEDTEEGNAKIETPDITFEMKAGEGVKINDERVLTVADLSFVPRVIGVDVFSEDTNYGEGDLVMYYNLLYRFTKNHFGDWKFDDVEETNLRELLNF